MPFYCGAYSSSSGFIPDVGSGKSIAVAAQFGRQDRLFGPKVLQVKGSDDLGIAIGGDIHEQLPLLFKGVCCVEQGGRGAIMGEEGSVRIERKKPERDWKEYNEHLVQRGEIRLAVESLQGWQEELRKNGRPFRYPHRLILFLGTLPALSATGGLCHPGPGLQCPLLAPPQAGAGPSSGLCVPGGGGGGDRCGWDGDPGDQRRGMDEKEAEGLHQGPCGG